MLAYCNLIDLDDIEVRELVLEHVQTLDEVFREHSAKVAKDAKDAVAAQPPAGP